MRACVHACMCVCFSCIGIFKSFIKNYLGVLSTNKIGENLK